MLFVEMECTVGLPGIRSFEPAAPLSGKMEGLHLGLHILGSPPDLMLDSDA
jgi:hypothetical protein